ncbi:class I SAM-dependent methyltransferase [Blastococcus deserti]|uniref:Class I SAM-dependent methyltransferase n=1 Tax=Blastococcus deserti TaxID=2259033 RepID=A0ABW4X823_9ACTN
MNAPSGAVEGAGRVRSASGYERRIGRYSMPLGVAFAEALGVRAGQRILDVGCGSGALTVALVTRCGTRGVVGVDPEEAGLRSCAGRAPGVALLRGVAERLPLASRAFDVVAAQLVLGLVDDPAAALAEMRRVCRPGGTVAGCVWDFAGGMTVLRAFWDAAVEVAPSATEHDQARAQRLTDPSSLAAAWHAAGLTGVAAEPIVVSATYADLEDLWQPLTVPDGGPGRFLALLTAAEREQIRGGLVGRLGHPAGPFSLTARAWSVRGTVPA